MGSTLHGKNRKNGNFDLNIYAHETLDYLGNGLKIKYGVYAPMLKTDCLILARILKNKARLLTILAGDSHHSLQNAMNFYMIINRRKDYLTDPETIDWIKKLADWFENCSGLVPEYGEIHCEDCEHFINKKCEIEDCKYLELGEPDYGGESR